MDSERSSIPLAVPLVGAAEARNLQACIDENFVSSVGRFVTEFERKVAESTGATDAVATSAGTTGLHVALVALGVSRDDLVLLPTYTFVASANAIAHCGAQPWLMDISPESWNLDLDQVHDELQRNATCVDGVLRHRRSGRRIAAAMPVYCLGVPIDFERLQAFEQEWKLPVVVDGAAAIGVCWRDQPLAAAGRLVVISFNGNKTITAGGGGMVVGQEPELLALVRHLTTTARVSADYTHDRVGFNYRMTNLQAAVGSAQMDRLQELIAAKRRIRASYDAAFADISGVTPFPNPPGGENGCWLSGLVIEDQRLPSVTTFCAKLAHKGIEARPFWKPVHLQAPYATAPRADSLAASERLWHRIVTLPCSTNLSENAQQRVVRAVASLLDKRR